MRRHNIEHTESSNDVMVPTLSSLAAPKFVVMKTFSGGSDDKFGILTILRF